MTQIDEIISIIFVWSSSDKYGLIGRLKQWLDTFSAIAKAPLIIPKVLERWL